MKVVLFLTKGLSLELWNKAGILEREISLYNKLQEHKCTYLIVSYNKTNEDYLLNKYPNIKVLHNYLKLPSFIYQLFIPIIYRREISSSDIIKTNQTFGSLTALFVSKIFSKPLIYRSGFLLSSNMMAKYGKLSIKYFYAYFAEFFLKKYSEIIVVSSPKIKREISQGRNLINSKIKVVPNFVDTNLFKPLNVKKKFDLIFVGRLSDEKNLQSLIPVAIKNKLSLKIIGDGPLRADLEKKYRSFSDKIVFLGIIDNKLIPKEIQSAKVFVLPSKYEGNPKSLLEAMSCGMPVIASDIQAIRMIIKNYKNGILSGTSEEKLNESVLSLLDNQTLQKDISISARETILSKFGIQNIAKAEKGLYDKLLK